MSNTKYIVCAAIKDNNGQVVCGARHFDQIMISTIENLKSFNTSNVEQGFIDQYGNFYNREQSLEIATNSKQINNRRPKTNPLNQLFSEDLY